MLLEWNGQPIKALTDLDTGIKKLKNGEAGKFKLARHKKDDAIWSR